MELQTYSIEGRAWHFGKHGIGQEETGASFPSDSLFAAMTSCASQLLNPADFEDWIKPFTTGQPPFLLTSAFPRAGKIRFFPAPLARKIPHLTADSTLSIKGVKKISYLSEEMFRRYLCGANFAELCAAGKSLQNGLILLSSDEFTALPPSVQRSGVIYEVEKFPHVTLSRDTNASALFQIGQVFFNQECGLWCAFQWLEHTNAQQDLLQSILSELSICGLGGNRSSGSGQSCIRPDSPLTFADAGENRNPLILLSRWLPTAEETALLAQSGSAYQIDTVSGWLSSPGIPAERRRAINLIREGSVIPGGCPLGRICDVQPDYDGTRPVGHPVWRFGYALGVPLKGATCE